MNEYGTTLRIELRPDRWVARMLLIAHAAAGLIVLVPLTVAPVLCILLGVGVAASFRLCYREHVERSAPGAVRAFSVSRSGDWLLVRNGVPSTESAQLKAWVLGERWLVLRFGLPRSRARSIVLSRAATDADLLRQLRARVRLVGSAACS